MLQVRFIWKRFHRRSHLISQSASFVPFGITLFFFCAIRYLDLCTSLKCTATWFITFGEFGKLQVWLECSDQQKWTIIFQRGKYLIPAHPVHSFFTVKSIFQRTKTTKNCTFSLKDCYIRQYLHRACLCVCTNLRRIVVTQALSSRSRRLLTMPTAKWRVADEATQRKANSRVKDCSADYAATAINAA